MDACTPDLAGKIELLCRLLVSDRMVPTCIHLLCEVATKGYAVALKTGSRSRVASVLIRKGILAKTRMRMCRAHRYTSVLVANTSTIHDLIEALNALAESVRRGRWCVDEGEYEKDVRPWMG